MVEVLGHVGEGFVAELTLVEGLHNVGLPVRHQEKQVKRTGGKKKDGSYHSGIERRRALPVHDQSHLRGEAIAAVHAQVPGHARVRAHVRMQ